MAFNRSKKNRSKSALFNPYENGISSYDMTYLSSRKSVFKDKLNQANRCYKKINLAG